MPRFRIKGGGLPAGRQRRHPAPPDRRGRQRLCRNPQADWQDR